MAKLISNYEELPLANRKVYDLVVQHSDGNVKQFAETIGVKQQVLDRIFKVDSRSGKYPSVSEGIRDGIREKFGFNDTWFYCEGYIPVQTERKPTETHTKPRIPYDAAAGTLTDAVEGVTAYQCEQLPVISAFPLYDFTIRVTGKSMEPEFYAGDEVACKRVNGKSFLQWGRVHVLDTTQGVVIKRIYDDGDCIRCKSYNPEFPDFSIPKSEIRSYNLVVGSLRL